MCPILLKTFCSTLNSWIGEFVFWCHEQVINYQIWQTKWKFEKKEFHYNQLLINNLIRNLLHLHQTYLTFSNFEDIFCIQCQIQGTFLGFLKHGRSFKLFWEPAEATSNPKQRELKQMEPILRAKVKNFFKNENFKKSFL